MAQVRDAVFMPERLIDVLDSILRATGSTAEEAGIVARNLVEADLKGHASHGVTQIQVYVQSQRLGHLTANRHARIVRDEPPFLLVEGDLGYGQVIARQATDLAIERARRHGATILALRNAHHIGRVGAFGEQCAEAGLIGIFFVNAVSRPLVAPHGGARPRLGTNPICIAVPPTPRHPGLLLDFATSAVAANKCRIAMAKGEEVADNLLIDPAGQPTRDPGVLFSDPTGALLPVGGHLSGHKGFGLALMCEILAGALAGGLPALPENLRPGRVINNALAFIIDPGRINGDAAWQALADSVLDYVQDTPPAPGMDRVRVPGEPEVERHGALSDQGVPVDPVTLAALYRIGEELNLDVEALLGPPC